MHCTKYHEVCTVSSVTPFFNRSGGVPVLGKSQAHDLSTMRARHVPCTGSQGDKHQIALQ